MRSRGWSRVAAGVVAMLICWTAACSSTSSLRASDSGNGVAAIELPPDFDRVLRDYERAWRARDAQALAELFTEDGFVLSNQHLPVRGRAAIATAYAGAGGELWLRAMSHARDGELGHIVGLYGYVPDEPARGKFVLALRRAEDGRWLIAADIENRNARPNQG
jgi:ketosteroid isomerase-like protein